MSTRTYRRRLTPSEAVQYDGTFPLAFLRDDEEVCAGVEPGSIDISSPRGRMRAHVGEWVVRGVTGDPFPISASAFELLYEPVVSAEQDGPS